MDKAQLRRDIEHLAADLHHRSANTESERSAATYLLERLSATLEDAQLDEFFSAGSMMLVFGLYYAEFFFIALFAFWWPWVFFAYGTLVFGVYLAEFTGYDLFTRFFPQYPTQNILARIHAEDPQYTFVVTAHCDSPKASLLTDPRIQPWLRPAHLVVLCSMLIVLATCAAQAEGIWDGAEFRPDLVIRGLAVSVSVVAATLLLWADSETEDRPGAHDNASGLAVLLGLSETFAKDPLRNADVWFVATGSNAAWMSGMRRLLATNRFARRRTYFLNIDSVGSGEVRYVTREGMLSGFRSSKEILAAAREAAPEACVAPHTLSGLPSDSVLALARGYRAMTVTSAWTREPRPDWDRAGAIDYDTVLRAGQFCEQTLRHLEDTLSSRIKGQAPSSEK